MSEDQVQSEEEVLRRAMFVPCDTKEALHRWICVYLGLNLPDTIVDPESNCTPMDAIWEIYQKARENDDPDFSRVMVYASRDSFKTLGASILEVLAVLHLDRDVAHMAAIKAQAGKAQDYVKKFFRLPFLRDYLVSSNTERTDITWYSNDQTGECITKDRYLELTEAERRSYTPHERYIKIVICTLQGSNSDHVPFFVVDEVDVVPKQNQPAYQEAKSIPGSFDGKEPITVLTSTRKFAFGNVQRELDEAEKTKLVVRHWNIIDVTERCPPSRHLPDQPKIPIWYRREDFSAIGKEDFDKLPPEEQGKYEKDTGYAGCLAKCKLFAMCRGNLATKQRHHERAVNPKTGKEEYVERPKPLLKSIRFTTNKFRELTLDMAKAQLMCWQASMEGLIYPYLDKQKHLLKPYQVAQKLTGERFPETFTYQELLALMKSREGKWVVGIDFGYTHFFSVVLMFVDGYRGFIMGRWGQPELDPAEKLDLLDRTVKEFDPTVYADTEAPDMISFLKKQGYRCPDWTKAPGSVLSGIDTVRYKLMPTLSGEPQLFFVEGGPGVTEHVDCLKLYHWEIGTDGRPTKDPDEVVSENLETGEKILDDECDALRYAVMNTFRSRGRGPSAALDMFKVPTPAEMESQHQANKVQENVWAKQIMEHVMGTRAEEVLGEEGEQPVGGRGRKGSVFWDMG